MATSTTLMADDLFLPIRQQQLLISLSGWNSANAVDTRSFSRLSKFWHWSENGQDDWTNGPTNGLRDKWTSGQMDKWSNGQMDKRTSGQVDKWTNRQMNKWTFGQGDNWTNGHLDLCAYKRRKNDWTNASSFHLRINYENWKVDHFSPLFLQPTFERCVPLYDGRCKNGPEVKSSELK